jgi:branched-chain amino acid transport system permease protein
MALDASFLSALVTDLTQPAQLFCLFLIIALTVNLEFGYAGIPNFGKVLFVAVGAFVAGSFAYRLMILVLGLKGGDDIFAMQASFVPQIDTQLFHNPALAVGLALLMLGLGAGFGSLVGLLSSYPAIRLREDYLGMLLLASGEFFNYASQAYYPFLGGAQGMTAPSPIADIGNIVKQQNLVVLALLIVAAIAIYFYSERVGRSPLGRTLRAMRDNEVASEALGKNNVAIRRNVLLVGSALAGAAGVLWLFYQPYIEPGVVGSFTRQTFTFIPFVIVIMGGAANNRGVLVGTVVYMALTESFIVLTSFITGAGYTFPIDLSRVRDMLIGGLLIVILLRRPQGLIPEKSTLTMARSKLKEIADSVSGKATEQKEKKV